MSRTVTVCFAISGLALTAFAASFIFVVFRHALIHSVTNIDPSHDHNLVYNIGLRVALVVIFGAMLRWLTKAETLGEWITIAVAALAIAWPVVLSGFIIAERNTHFMSVSGTDESRHVVLSFTYLLNLLSGAVYGLLGWLFLRRLIPDNKGTEVPE